MPLTDCLSDYLPADFLELYEVHNYRHAAEVLATGCPDEFAELVAAVARYW
jgi:CRISPR-associated protein Csd2